MAKIHQRISAQGFGRRTLRLPILPTTARRPRGDDARRARGGGGGQGGGIYPSDFFSSFCGVITLSLFLLLRLAVGDCSWRLCRNLGLVTHGFTGTPLSLGGWSSVLAPRRGTARSHMLRTTHTLICGFGSHLTVPWNLLYKFVQPRASSVLARLVQHRHLSAYKRNLSESSLLRIHQRHHSLRTFYSCHPKHRL